MLQRRPAPRIGDKAITNLVPFLPTTVRQFHTGDDVEVFVRIYQGGKGRIVPVTMIAKVTNEKNSVTSSQEGICPGSCRKALWRDAPAERLLTVPPYAA
jgi:hypothetical protein